MLDALGTTGRQPSRSQAGLKYAGAHPGRVAKQEGEGRVLNRPDLIETVRRALSILAPSELPPGARVGGGAALRARVLGRRGRWSIPGRAVRRVGADGDGGHARFQDSCGVQSTSSGRKIGILPGMKALFELVDRWRRASAQSGDAGGTRGPVRAPPAPYRPLKLSSGSADRGPRSSFTGINFWGGAVVSDRETPKRLARKAGTRRRMFLESVRPFNTPGRFKNFKLRQQRRFGNSGAGLEDLLGPAGTSGEGCAGRGGEILLLTWRRRPRPFCLTTIEWAAQASEARRGKVCWLSLRDRGTWNNHGFRRCRLSGAQLRDLQGGVH